MSLVDFFLPTGECISRPSQLDSSSTPDQASNVDRKIRAGTAKCCLRSRSIPLNTFECNRMLVTQSEPNVSE